MRTKIAGALIAAGIALAFVGGGIQAQEAGCFHIYTGNGEWANDITRNNSDVEVVWRLEANSWRPYSDSVPASLSPSFEIARLDPIWLVPCVEKPVFWRAPVVETGSRHTWEVLPPLSTGLGYYPTTVPSHWMCSLTYWQAAAEQLPVRATLTLEHWRGGSGPAANGGGPRLSGETTLETLQWRITARATAGGRYYYPFRAVVDVNVPRTNSTFNCEAHN